MFITKNLLLLDKMKIDNFLVNTKQKKMFYPCNTWITFSSLSVSFLSSSFIAFEVIYLLNVFPIVPLLFPVRSSCGSSIIQNLVEACATGSLRQDFFHVTVNVQKWGFGRFSGVKEAFDLTQSAGCITRPLTIGQDGSIPDFKAAQGRFPTINMPKEIFCKRGHPTAGLIGNISSYSLGNGDKAVDVMNVIQLAQTCSTQPWAHGLFARELEAYDIRLDKQFQALVAVLTSSSKNNSGMFEITDLSSAPSSIFTNQFESTYKNNLFFTIDDFYTKISEFDTEKIKKLIKIYGQDSVKIMLEFKAQYESDIFAPYRGKGYIICVDGKTSGQPGFLKIASTAVKPEIFYTPPKPDFTIANSNLIVGAHGVGIDWTKK